MPLHPRLSRAAIKLVEAFETFHAVARPLSSGGWTIGYGHTLTAREGAALGREDGRALLIYDLNRAAEVVSAALYAPASQHQFDALVAFCFNIGEDNFLASSALTRFNAGAPLEAADEIERWRRAELGGGAQVVDALVRRRAAEKAHFLGLPEGLSKSPSAVLRPLSGDAVHPPLAPAGEPQPAQTSALLAAANSIQARLRDLVPDGETGREPAPEPTAEASEEAEAPPFPPIEPSPPVVAPEPQPELHAEAEPDPQSEPELEPPSEPVPETDRLQMEPGAASPGPTRSAEPPSAAPYAPPPPALPGPEPVEPANDLHAPPPPLARLERPERLPEPAPEPTEAAPSSPDPQAGAPVPMRRRTPFVLAAVGAALMVIAALLILGGRADLSSLLVGGLGALTLATAIYGLLGPTQPRGSPP
jgi:lysozyme